MSGRLSRRAATVALVLTAVAPLAVFGLAALALAGTSAPVPLLAGLLLFALAVALAVSISAARPIAAAVEAGVAGEAQMAALVIHSGDAIMNYALDGAILSWNPAAERLFGWSAAEAIGAHARLIASEDRRAEQTDILQRLARGETFHYETRRRAKDGTDIDVSIATAPVKDAVGKILSISAVVRDIRHRVRTGQQLEIVRKEAEERAREAEAGRQLLETLLAHVPTGIVIAGGPPDFPIIAQSHHGIAAMQGNKIVRAEPEPPPSSRYLKMDGTTPYRVEELPLYRATRLGETTHGFETIIERADGTRMTVLYDAAPLTGPSGQITGAVCCSADITQRQRGEEQRAFLTRELAHRSKNLLAVILAMLRQSIRNSDSMADFEQKFMNRILGLAASHDMLLARDWDGASIFDLAQSHLSHFADLIGERILLSGPSVILKSEAAQNIGLALHELSTNAAKYGALSQDSGQVAIQWSVRGQTPGSEMFHLSWRETGGPRVCPPSRRGFGQIVVERLVAQSLEGTVALDFHETGVSWQLAIPAKFVTAGAAEELAAQG